MKYAVPTYERTKLALRLEPIIIKEKAKERKVEAGKTYGVGSIEKVVQKSAQAIKNKSRDELAKISGVSNYATELYTS